LDCCPQFVYRSNSSPTYSTPIFRRYSMCVVIFSRPYWIFPALPCIASPGIASPRLRRQTPIPPGVLNIPEKQIAPEFIGGNLGEKGKVRPFGRVHRRSLASSMIISLRAWTCIRGTPDMKEIQTRDTVEIHIRTELPRCPCRTKATDRYPRSLSALILRYTSTTEIPAA